MIQSASTVLLWFAAIGCGMMAGLYFAFSTFIMTALGRIPQAHGISAMQSINSTILRSLFMPLFWGTTLAALLLAASALFRPGEAAAMAMLAAGIIYVVGMFVCTVIFNVPLNNALDAVDPSSTEAAAVWARYLKDWTFWNHLRTIASAAASALFVVALAAR
ncbi:MAG: DUF1772 domain-containing protein [Candidatus Afipia apatlaquensis]|uniref:DUF1772 domain-containing protein n=1 Tax=Candidatus Afipia apatlaquensis TaxID=2712852 RepID=A0A7C9RI45_9BRAD|nr:DUF1772 domain-containing protein [Candidatus Afipia apatlaquensis]